LVGRKQADLQVPEMAAGICARSAATLKKFAIRTGGKMPAKSLDTTEVALPLFRPGSKLGGEAFAFSSHARAREAIEFGLSIHDFGFNIFVLGAENSGRMTATLDFLMRPLPTCHLRTTLFI